MSRRVGSRPRDEFHRGRASLNRWIVTSVAYRAMSVMRERAEDRGSASLPGLLIDELEAPAEAHDNEQPAGTADAPVGRQHELRRAGVDALQGG